eukprot:Pgem_evm1s6726
MMRQSTLPVLVFYKNRARPLGKQLILKKPLHELPFIHNQRARVAEEIEYNVIFDDPDSDSNQGNDGEDWSMK